MFSFIVIRIVFFANAGLAAAEISRPTAEKKMIVMLLNAFIMTLLTKSNVFSVISSTSPRDHVKLFK